MIAVQRRETRAPISARAENKLPESPSPLRQQLRAASFSEGEALLAPTPDVQRSAAPKAMHHAKGPSEAAPRAGGDLAAAQQTLGDLQLGCDAMRVVIQREQLAAIARGDILQTARLADVSRALGQLGQALAALNALPDLADAAAQLAAMRDAFAAARASGNATDQAEGYLAALRMVGSASGPLGLVPGFGDAAAIIGALARVAAAPLEAAMPYFGYIDGVFDCTSQDVIGDPVNADGSPRARRSCGGE